MVVAKGNRFHHCVIQNALKIHLFPGQEVGQQQEHIGQKEQPLQRILLSQVPGGAHSPESELLQRRLNRPHIVHAVIHVQRNILHVALGYHRVVGVELDQTSQNLPISEILVEHHQTAPLGLYLEEGHLGPPQ